MSRPKSTTVQPRPSNPCRSVRRSFASRVRVKARAGSRSKDYAKSGSQVRKRTSAVQSTLNTASLASHLNLADALIGRFDRALREARGLARRLKALEREGA